MSSQRRTKVFGHSGHESGSVCLAEGPPGFLLWCGGSSLRASELLGWVAVAELSLSSWLNSEKGSGDTGNAGLSGEMLIPVLLSEVLELKPVLPWIEFV